MTAPLGAAEGDLAVVRRLVRPSGTSSHRGTRILSPDRRAVMHAAYMFCRLQAGLAPYLAGRRA